MKLRRKEQVKEIKGYEGLYSVTTLGRVWSHRSNIWLKQGIDGGGYPNVDLSVNGKPKTYKVHILVGKAFISNPDSKPQINHMNGDKKDCRASNLEWVTAQENIQHSIDMGLSKIGKLSRAKKMLVCHLRLVQKLKLKEIAEMFKVTIPAIYYIIKTYTPQLEANHSL
jgi:hypothetical protein